MVRSLFRLLGGGLLLAGVVLLVRDLLPLVSGAGFAPEAFGALWSGLDPNSLGWLRDAIAYHLVDAVWEHGVLPVLQQPAFVIGIVVGALLLLLTRARPRWRGLN